MDKVMMMLEQNKNLQKTISGTNILEFGKQVILKDDSRLTIRMIRPEDEILWLDLLRRCSQNSIYRRFQYAFHWQSHRVAHRYCTIDTSHEIAIVPELKENGTTKLLGVARLISDLNRHTAEFAILIADAWQHRGLGSILTDYCIKIANSWGCKKIIAQTTKDNPQMISIFKKRGFRIIRDPSSSTVQVVKVLSDDETESKQEVDDEECRRKKISGYCGQ
jgi:acetyltransferase